MTNPRATDRELADEAKLWSDRVLTEEGWRAAPEAVPRGNESVAISIRIPRPMLTILKEFARREGVGYQVLMKRWLDDRIRTERDRRLATPPIRLSNPRIFRTAACFVLPDEARLSASGGIDEMGRLAECIDVMSKP